MTDWGEFAEEKPKGDSGAQIQEMIDRLVEAQRAVVDAEVALKDAQKALSRIEEYEFPEMLDELGTLEMTVEKDGKTKKVALKKTIRASIPKENKPLVYKWMEDHGHGGMIKRSLEVAYNKHDEDAIRKLREDILVEHGYDCRTNETVNAQTFAAFARKQLEAGKELPQEHINIFEQRKVVVK